MNLFFRFCCILCIIAFSVEAQNPDTMQINEKVSITAHPLSTTVTQGKEATFTVKASGGKKPYDFQWQRKKGDKWEDVDGAEEDVVDKLKINKVSKDDEGEYRCYVTDGDDARDTSRSATLTIGQPARIVNHPENTVGWTGNSVSVGIKAAGTAPITYQWQKKDGDTWKDIPSGTSETLKTKSVKIDDAGLYRCIASNEFGSDTSNEAELTVKITVSITAHPEGAKKWPGENHSFTITAAGTQPISYQWQKYENNSWHNIGGANEASLTIVSLKPLDQGRYRCVANNGGGTAESQSATLLVNKPVKITQQPQNIVGWTGKSASLFIAAEGGAPITYRWQKKEDDWVDVENATNDTLTIGSVKLSDAGTYRCIVSNESGAVTSDEAVFTVNVTVSITKHPESAAKWPGENVSFSVTAAGAEPLSYQWQKYGTGSWDNITNATKATLTLNSVKQSDAGTYRCAARNGGGSVTSHSAILTVNTPVKITRQPQNATGWTDNSASFSITAQGSDPITYQWQRNINNAWADIANATSATLTLNSIKTSDARPYRCVVKNGGGSDTSDTAVLTVKKSPFIVEHPSNSEQWTGKSITFSISATGDELQYQWARKINNNWYYITNANNATLTINPVQENSSQGYRCMVSNGGGTVWSNVAFLKIKITASITADPSDATAWTGKSASFSVGAAGDDVLYRWQRLKNAHWEDIQGATNKTYTIARVTQSDAGSYRCIAYNGGGGAESRPAVLTVKTTAVVSDHPDDTEQWTGKNVTFSIQVQGDEVKYQWQKGSHSISNATNNTYTIEQLTLADSGMYRCIAYNDGGADTSRFAKLAINQTAKITHMPADKEVFTGENVEFSITAVGTDIQYQWQKDEKDISGQQASTITINNVVKEDGGAYRCIVANGGGSDTSASAFLMVKGKVSVSIDPVDTSVFPGNTACFQITANGSLPITYQWQKNASDISGASDRIFTIDSVILSDTGTYRCIVTNSGGSDTSSAAQLIILEPVSITTHPESQTKNQGDEVIFTVVASGHPPLSYQWQKDDVDISGATSSTFKIASVDISHAGLYRCQVINGGGMCISNSAALSINGPAIVIKDPEDQTGWLGDSAAFSIIVSGSEPMTYQWQKDGADISAPSNRELVIYPVTQGSEGAYRCIISNAAGRDTSTAAALTVSTPVTITAHPAPVNAVEGDSVVMSVTASGTEPMTYQWIKNDFPVSGETSPQLVINPVTAADAGTYACIAGNGGGCDTSETASLTVGNAGLSVVLPNGGEKWYINTKETITWTTLGNVSNVKIEYSTTGGTTWQMITGSTPNTGSYVWDVPITLTAFCKIRVSDAEDGIPADESDSLFAIGNISAIKDKSKNKGKALGAHFTFVPNPVSQDYAGSISLVFTPVAKNISSLSLYVYDHSGNQIYTKDIPHLSRSVHGKYIRIPDIWNVRRSGHHTVAPGAYSAVIKIVDKDGAVQYAKVLLGVKEK